MWCIVRNLINIKISVLAKKLVFKVLNMNLLLYSKFPEKRNGTLIAKIILRLNGTMSISFLDSFTTSCGLIQECQVEGFLFVSFKDLFGRECRARDRERESA